MRYLVIRFSSLGDCILLCSSLAALADRAAGEIAVVTKEAYRELFTAVRGIDRVFCLPGGASLRDTYKLARSLRSCGYHVVDAHATLRSRMFTAFLGECASRFDKRYRSRLMLILFKRRVAIPTMAERYAALFPEAPAADNTIAARPVLEIPAAVEESLPPAITRRTDAFVAFAPGSRWQAKRWGADQFRELARAIIGRFGFRIVLLGDDGDRERNGTLARALGKDALDLTGETSIIQAAACLARVRALVSNDSGLMHLAEAVGTPVLGLFGPTVEAFGYYPSLPGSTTCERALACRPCSRNGSRSCLLGTRACLRGIDAGTVTEIFSDMIGGSARRRYVLP